MDFDRQTQFGQLLEAHRGIVLKVAHGYAWHPEDRADLAQEIATQLWRAFPRYDPARSFSTWMYRIALNVAISSLRARRQDARTVPLDERLHEPLDSAAASLELQQQVGALRRFIHRQEPLNRALLLLYLEDRPHAQIADILGISVSNVATKIGRLKQRIHNEL
ncbi:sigma-70 family RNA polymerase sigma factor [Lysobacter sp. LF1]|uniref:Sigma-70 family RNA polymerase sigma factor n=1 Tax=Lysobacter stagni TaxID=3045172 RepID=A0ABT6XJQ9_9GAMM|nr:sigma-70 family RNA polymerase sigma factor [Lysobacter sp. LF1]MDI9240402.1 sigma-70 family RNA polymerase sigma factor [Lysobacter sp. LF1]